MSSRGAPPLIADSDDNYDDEDTSEDDDEPAPRARKPAARAAVKPSRRSEAFVLPPLTVLAAPKASERHTQSPDVIEDNAKSLEGVLRGFRRARRDRQCAPRPGRHAV